MQIYTWKILYANKEKALVVNTHLLIKIYELECNKPNNITCQYGILWNNGTRYSSFIISKALFEKLVPWLWSTKTDSQLEKRERRILRMIFGNRRISREVRLRPNGDFHIKIIVNRLKRKDCYFKRTSWEWPITD